MIRTIPIRTSLLISLMIFLLALALVSLPLPAIHGQEKKAADPWASSETMQPAQLAKILTDKYVSVPTVIFVGFRSLYVGGHVPDASYHGTASTEQGLAELKAWADSLPRSTELVIYCGCCPWDHCPNIGAAFSELRQLGFRNVKVLYIAHDFGTDWMEKGYPVTKED